MSLEIIAHRASRCDYIFASLLWGVSGLHLRPILSLCSLLAILKLVVHHGKVDG